MRIVLHEDFYHVRFLPLSWSIILVKYNRIDPHRYQQLYGSRNRHILKIPGKLAFAGPGLSSQSKELPSTLSKLRLWKRIER